MKNTPRWKCYKAMLNAMLAGSIVALCIVSYLGIANNIPDQIKLRAGVEQNLNFDVPVSAEIYKTAVEASDFGKSMIPTQKIEIALNRKVTVKAKNIDSYRMDVKLFGVIPIKSIDIEIIQDTRLIPVGMPIGIYVKTEGVLVIGTGTVNGMDGLSYEPSKYLLQSGDYILKVNGQETIGKKQLMEQILASNGQEMIFTVRREKEVFEISVTPKLNETEEYKIGVWLRDSAQGIGTLTYINEENGFGALGHGITDVDTSTLMDLKAGILYDADIIAVKKGENGNPGELTGIIDYSENHVIGEISANTEKGIFGNVSSVLTETMQYEALPIGLKQEVKVGPAKIICSVEGKSEAYEAQIKEINYNSDIINRGIVLEITDEDLLSLTGGIVQGMSGSPIIQDGKIIGAVTHVLVQDSAKGYGIFIEEMLGHSN